MTFLIQSIINIPCNTGKKEGVKKVLACIKNFLTNLNVSNFTLTTTFCPAEIVVSETKSQIIISFTSDKYYFQFWFQCLAILYGMVVCNFFTNLIKTSAAVLKPHFIDVK